MVSVRMPKRLLERLDVVAVEMGKTRTEVVLMALRRFLGVV
jgi:metal-responsive CopG/Arc/MetJ family transcriptional regulator